MASAAEQFVANFNLGAFTKATDLKARLKFTLIALIIYRFGTYIPVPGISPEAWQEIFQQKSGGVLDMFNMFTGGALQRMSLFTMGIMPYITASIIMQMMSVMVPSLARFKKDGANGQKKLNQYTRYGTVLLASVQAYALSIGLESMAGGMAVLDPGMFFRITAVITLVGGTIFLMWLGEQITARGVGNGLSLIIFAGIVAELPRAIAGTLELGREGALPAFMIFVIIAMVIAVITFIVFMERASRRVVVQYPKRQQGNKMYAADSSHLPLKLNSSGVIPPIFASSLLLFPMTLVGFSGSDGSAFLDGISRYLQHGTFVYMALYAALIAFFCFFYTAIVFNPQEKAEDLKRGGGFVPGIRPGAPTGDYLNFVLSRITVLGAAYLVAICLLPEFIMAKHQLPFYFGGTSLLIVVTVVIDTVGQIQSHLLAHQYEGLIRKTKLRGRRK